MKLRKIVAEILYMLITILVYSFQIQFSKPKVYCCSKEPVLIAIVCDFFFFFDRKFMLFLNIFCFNFVQYPYNNYLC
jgi:hypothetical protein